MAAPALTSCSHFCSAGGGTAFGSDGSQTMVNTPEIEESGAADLPCATCGHTGHEHVVRDIEVAGNTLHETFCEGCDAPCEYRPTSER